MLVVQFPGLGYYYPSTEKIDRSTKFGAVGYIITFYSSKAMLNLGVRPNFGEVRTPRPHWLRPCVIIKGSLETLLRCFTNKTTILSMNLCLLRSCEIDISLAVDKHGAQCNTILANNRIIAVISMKSELLNVINEMLTGNVQNFVFPAHCLHRFLPPVKSDPHESTLQRP